MCKMLYLREDIFMITSSLCWQTFWQICQIFMYCNSSDWAFPNASCIVWHEKLSQCPCSVCQPARLRTWECSTCVWVMKPRVLCVNATRSSCLQEDKMTLVGHQGPDVQCCTTVWFGYSQLRGDLEMLRSFKGQIPHIVLHSLDIQRTLFLAITEDDLFVAALPPCLNNFNKIINK